MAVKQRRTDLLNPPSGFEWVSCNGRDYGSAGNSIHLISKEARKREHWQTTVCGSTANQAGIWRRPAWNSTKPRCATCVEKEKTPPRGTTDVR